MMPMDPVRYRNPLILALLSGLLIAAAFPKPDQGWMAWFALVPLMLALRQVDPRAGFWIGFGCGFVNHLGVIYWTAYTMRIYGHLPVAQAVMVLILLTGVLALFTALFALILCRVCRKPWHLMVVAPAAWTALEWLRSWIFTGFPWALLGYSQHNRLWIIQIADVTGVYGISALIVAINALLALTVLRWAEKPWQTHPVSPRVMVRAAIVIGITLAVTTGYGIQRLRTVDFWVAEAQGASVAVVQGNIDQSIKWDAAFQMLTTAKYRNLSLAAAQNGAELVIWPETATPFYLLRDPLLTEMVVQGIQEAGTHFIIGSPFVDTLGDEAVYYNSAYLVTPAGVAVGRYDKVHLVPFGEYVPLKRFLPFVGKMVAHVGDFQPGVRGSALLYDTHPIGMLICYEIIFPGLARDMARSGGRLLVNITNDAWFGRTSAPYQHFSMAVFRSVENRRFLARAANTGISGFIDPCGRILAASGLFEDAALLHEVKFLESLTFYTRWGDWPLMAISFGTLLIGFITGARPRQRYPDGSAVRPVSRR